MLQLRGAFSENPRLRPLVEGAITPQDIDVKWEEIAPGEAFLHHLQQNDFDIFEFSISNYMMVRQLEGRGWDWTAIPVFLSKAMPIISSVVNERSGIEGPEDLRGKSFGMGEFSMTAGLWLRAMIDALYGIRPQDLRWYAEDERDEILEFRGKQPKDLSITWLDRPGAVLEMVQAGELDAAFGVGAARGGLKGVRPLLPDGGRSLFEAYYRKTGLTPVNHTVVVQRRVLDENPWAGEALFDALERSKQEAYRRDRSARGIFGGSDLDWQESVFGADPYPVGLAANRKMIEAAAEQSSKEGLTRQPVVPDELFHESVRGT
jgi:4,5-dihydroxyphthalate decarboxylase